MLLTVTQAGNLVGTTTALFLADLLSKVLIIRNLVYLWAVCHTRRRH